MENRGIVAIPAACFAAIQIIKFIKFSTPYEVLLSLTMSFPFIVYFYPNLNKKDACTQTNMDVYIDTPDNFFDLIKKTFINFINFFSFKKKVS